MLSIHHTGESLSLATGRPSYLSTRFLTGLVIGLFIGAAFLLNLALRLKSDGFVGSDFMRTQVFGNREDVDDHDICNVVFHHEYLWRKYCFVIGDDLCCPRDCYLCVFLDGFLPLLEGRITRLMTVERMGVSINSVFSLVVIGV